MQTPMWPRVTAALALTLACAACGGSDTPRTATADTPATTAPNTTTTTTGPEARDTSTTTGTSSPNTSTATGTSSPDPLDTTAPEGTTTTTSTTNNTTTTTSTTTTTTTGPSSTDHHGAAGEPTRFDAELADAAQTITVEIVGGTPVDGHQRAEVALGSVVALMVSSNTAEEVHVHGYDILRTVSSGHPAHFAFKAEIPGVFEVELEASGRLLLLLQIS